ncbi:hypothetical protein [Thermoplasma acidophilum]|uniref:Uncharacterized protein n=1 Tax=Thermoplasma acidophilum (strain ATCC 25905 / DSM 1728 / JCM 9062 / NBRC 15155 / AMRC-C165) TaxID=273075 RepID=Q9HL48_THEAC|nr:hypothetical protein [Thermoplasma acidophilum]
MSIALISIPADGEVMVVSHANGTGVQIQRPITINITSNATKYKGATFVWDIQNGTVSGNYVNITGLLRIHVNWDVSDTNYFVNILSINSGTLKNASFNVSLDQIAKQANKVLNNSETSTLTVYIKQGLQSSSSMGTVLNNQTIEGPFNITYPTFTPYYIGFYYAQPPDTNNSVGQYLNFTFDFVYL